MNIHCNNQCQISGPAEVFVYKALIKMTRITTACVAKYFKQKSQLQPACTPVVQHRQLMISSTKGIESRYSSFHYSSSIIYSYRVFLLLCIHLRPHVCVASGGLPPTIPITIKTPCSYTDILLDKQQHDNHNLSQSKSTKLQVLTTCQHSGKLHN